MKETLAEVVDGSFRLLELNPKWDEVDVFIIFIMLFTFIGFTAICGVYALAKWIIGRLFDR